MERRESASAYYIACQGTVADVRMSPEAEAHYLEVIEGKDEISVKRKVQLARYFREFCENAHFSRRMSDQKFKNEGNFPDGHGTQVTVWTFKSWQWRLYGAILRTGGKICFVGVKVDPAKKRDRADQQMLKATAKAIAALAEYRPKS
jgi:hypothetical protein